MGNLGRNTVLAATWTRLYFNPLTYPIWSFCKKINAKIPTFLFPSFDVYKTNVLLTSYGQLYLSRRSRCKIVLPVYPLFVCNLSFMVNCITKHLKYCPPPTTPLVVYNFYNSSFVANCITKHLKYCPPHLLRFNFNLLFMINVSFQAITNWWPGRQN